LHSLPFSFGTKSQTMKRILIAGYALFAIVAVHAQQKEGKVTYERTMQMEMRFAGINEEMQRMIPRSMTHKFELDFSNKHSVWRQATEPETDDVIGGEGGGFQVRMSSFGGDDIVYTNFEKGKRIEQREMFDKKFIVDDSVRALKWKMTGETKNILNHKCMKATATQISQRMRMAMEDGKMERKEMADTMNIVAWFATDIPVPAGPGEFQGQLPGLILEMNMNEGRIVYKALNISPKADVAAIKEPTGKKRYTQEEYRKERDKMMEEMQRNNGRGDMRRVFMN
jgi:GLPGLI family protein